MPTNAIERLLKSQTNKAFHGYCVWRRLLRQYRFKKKSKIIFVLEPGSSDEICSLLFLRDLERTVGDDTDIWYFTPNSEAKKLIPLFSARTQYIFISQEDVESIEIYHQLRKIDARVIIASISRPFGRIGERIIGANGIRYDEVFAIGVYGIWDYTHPIIPNYITDDDSIRHYMENISRAVESWEND